MEQQGETQEVLLQDVRKNLAPDSCEERPGKLLSVDFGNWPSPARAHMLEIMTFMTHKIH
jgi:hypothetical protein